MKYKVKYMSVFDGWHKSVRNKIQVKIQNTKYKYKYKVRQTKNTNYKYMSVFDGWGKSVRDRPINATGHGCLEYRGANNYYIFLNKKHKYNIHMQINTK